MLDVMYQYSLPWFLTLFEGCLDSFRKNVLEKRLIEIEEEEE
jgi:hypothetical protein